MEVENVKNLPQYIFVMREVNWELGGGSGAGFEGEEMNVTILCIMNLDLTLEKEAM